MRQHLLWQNSTDPSSFTLRKEALPLLPPYQAAERRQNSRNNKTDFYLYENLKISIFHL